MAERRRPFVRSKRKADVPAVLPDRIFARLRLPVKVGDVRTFDGRAYVVDTCHPAEDFKDAKCTLVAK